MTWTRVADAQGWVDGLGGLHDARIRTLEFDFDTRMLTLALDDINANHSGLPGDPGRMPGALRFSAVEDASVKEGAAGWIVDTDVETGKARKRCRTVQNNGATIEFSFLALDLKHLA